MVTLDSLSSAGKKRKRVGRGGSRGGTSGKGHKGQKARSGPKIAVQFEGGQMPLTRRLPKRGFNNARFAVGYEIVNLGALSECFDAGTLVNAQSLYERGLIRGGRRSIKILADGSLDKKLIVHADKFSKAAADSILQAGGEVHVTDASGTTGNANASQVSLGKTRSATRTSRAKESSK